MTALTDIIAPPLIQIEVLIALAALAFALTLFAVARGLKGAWLRAGAALALTLALLDPALVREDREPLADIVLAVVDESASQDIENRRDETAAALAALEADLRAMAAQPGAQPIELETLRVAGDGARGTELGRAISKAMAELPPARLSAVVALTDGAVSDEAAVLDGLAEAARKEADGPRGASTPIHALVTGRDDEFDRRLVVETAPAFGLVGQDVQIKLRIEETGPAPVDAGLPRLEVLVDGKPALDRFVPAGRSNTLTLNLSHPGRTVVELRLEPLGAEITDRNNVAAFSINAVRDRLEVLLVSGQPHAGERTWRNLLKSDPAVDLVHFTILRPPGKPSVVASQRELALIPFPTEELFDRKIDRFDLIIFDRYRNWGVLIRPHHMQNIVDHVFGGGAVLVSSGPDFAGRDSVYNSPLRRILPGAPTTRVFEEPYRPRVTELGARHPVTRGLPGSGVAPGAAAADATPTWGRWFRLIDLAPRSGDVLMAGPAEKPLLLLDRVGQGRVAMIASDHPWLWTRGYDGGGPQSELLRRLAHWLMREPELEEESLVAAPAPGGFEVERRSLTLGDKAIDVVDPDGARRRVELEAAGEGLWRAIVPSEKLGVHRLEDAEDSVIAAEGAEREALTAIAVVGPPSPREFANPVSTTALLAPVSAASGGATLRLASASRAPDFRRVSDRGAAAGSGWVGFPRREAYEVRGVTFGELAPPWVFFLLAAGFAVAAWRVEGR